MLKTVRLIECMNWSWQGEGENRGKKTLILRFKRCNRNCWFCDTKVKMKVMEEAEYSISDIQTMVNENNLQVMITGGEPTYNNNLLGTILLLNKIDCEKFEVETNGFQLERLISEVKTKKNVTYVLSPKLFNTDDLDFYKNLVNVIKDNDNVIIKFVVEPLKSITYPHGTTFLDYLKEIKFNTNKLWLMPEGKTREELLLNSPRVFDLCEKYSANFSSRDHVIYDFV